MVEKIRSIYPRLNQALQGGLPVGALTEIGMPFGQDGREVIAGFLAWTTQHQYRCLLSMGYPNIRVFPPAWFARGVCPNRAFFAQSVQPVRELKQALMGSIFKLIVLDVGPKQLTLADCAFLRQVARKNQYAVVVLRSYWVSNKRGNPWARLRFNLMSYGEGYRVHLVRGLPPRHIQIPSLRKVA